MALTNYLEDDWDDNSLTNRTDPQKDVFYQYSTGGTGDLLKGVYRPRWEVVSPITNVSNGELQHNTADGTGEVSTPSSIYTASFTHSWAYTNLGNNNDRLYFYIIYEAIDFFYRTQITDSANTNYRLQKAEGGSGSNIISSSWPGDTNSHTTEVTRSSYGDFELFFDGASKGTVTDGYMPDLRSVNIQFDDNGGGSEMVFDDLVIK